MVMWLIVDMLVARDTSSSQTRADGRNDNIDDDNDEESFEQLFVQLRVMKGHCHILCCGSCDVFLAALTEAIV